MSKKNKAKTQPIKPRRWTPKQSKRITGWLMVAGILIAMPAIHFQLTWLLIVAVAEWAVSLTFMLWHWRCPACGKSLPKTGKLNTCPRCGADIT